MEDVEILIEHGRVVKLSRLPIGKPADGVVDLRGLLVIPGLIDVHVHLRGLNLAYKEDYDTGTLAAAAGGVTTVLDMPNTDPPTEDAESLMLKIRVAERRVYANVGFYGFIPKDLAELPKMAELGAFGFKVFTHRRMPGYRFERIEDLKEPFKAAAEVGLPILVHAEDREAFNRVRSENPGGGLEAFERALPEGSEEKAVCRVLRLARKVRGVKIHICHVSSPRSLSLIAEAKAEGLPVTCEVTPHHLLLTNEVYRRLGFYGLVDPPLRSRRSVEGLWSGLREGLIDCIATDHAPHTFEEKTAGEFWNLKTGFPGLETILPLMLDCVNRGWLSLAELIRLTSEKPAAVFKIEDRGAVEVGYWADLTAVNLKEEVTIEPSEFNSKAKHSPFRGWRVRGAPKTVFVNGDPVILDGEVLDKPGIGAILKPGVS